MKLKLTYGFLLLISTFFSFQSVAQRGVHLDYVIPGSNHILNAYTSLTGVTGPNTITVTNGAITGGSFFGANPLAAGELVLIVQMQGANINIETYTYYNGYGPYTVPVPYTFSNTGSDHIHEWGAIEWTGYFGEALNGWNNAGKFEYAEVKSRSGNTIELQCDLKNSYDLNGHVQVVRIPRFNNLDVPLGTSAVPTYWDGTTGGILAIEVDGDLTLNGELNADERGFRGGQLDNVGETGNNDPAYVNEYRFLGSDQPLQGSEKGEGIHGYHAELDALVSRYGIAGASNGGGGGGFQNTGGGGGSNIYVGALRYTGSGVPDPAYNAFWALDISYPNFNYDPQTYSSLSGNPSPGGGRGGYAYSDTDRNEAVVGPRNTLWGGDARKSNGGRGGHALKYDPTRIFFGGGGGAGDQDSGEGGAGGRGGGIVFLKVYGNVTGSGLISSNGQDGQNTNPTNIAPTFGDPRKGNDGGGGGGAGGYVYVENTNALPASITISATGGDGGDQILTYLGPLPDEAGGPGGGGAGGAIAFTSGSPSQVLTGGLGGTTTSSHIANFPYNGATGGYVGVPSLPTTIYDLVVSDVTICSGQTANLTATVTGTLPTGGSVEWYNAEFGGSVLWVGTNYPVTPASTTTYWVGVCDGGTFRKPVTVTVSPAVTGTDVQTACGSYTWIDGLSYNASTNTPTYTITNGSVFGCDSIVTLNLTITPFTTGTDIQSVCGSYTWIDGMTYNASTNTPTHTILGGASNGCDSVVTLNLTINNPTTGTDFQSACGSYTWIDGMTYNASTNTPTYTILNGASNGCDSTVTLNLTINNPTTGTDTQIACGSYTWIDGMTYNASTNTPTYTILNGATNGCDSIVTLNLTINNPTIGTDIQTACGSYTWIDGLTYNSSTNTPTFTIPNGAANGCDSTVTLNLTINNPTTGTDLQVACGSYTWIDGMTYNSSTNTPTFTILNGAANGCDSIVTLNLTINNPTSGTDFQTTCGSYTWIDGLTYNSSTNTPTFTILNGAANGCDSTVTLNLTINNPTTGTDFQTACGSFTWIDGMTYSASTNTPTFTIPNGAANGCDSTVTLDLTITTFASGIDVQSACGNFTWIDGITYNTSTNTPTYTFLAGASNGCDSIVTLNLTINNPTTGTDIQSACGSYTWIDGMTYNASTNTPTYTIVNGSANGCDSIVTLNLTINNATSGADVQTACNSYTWIDGMTYNASTNTPTFTIPNGAANGCDSIVTLNLTITTFASGTDVQTACGSYTWIDGMTYNASTSTPTFTIPNGAVSGCDSVVTLNLTINNATTGTDIQSACGSYTWIDGMTYNASTNTPTYTIVNGAANGCDSIVSLNLTINNSTSGTDVQTACETYTWIDGNTYTASTNTPMYTIVGGSSAGCDSTVTLNLTIINSSNGTDVQTACGSYTWLDGNTYTSSTSTPTFTIVNGAANGCDSIVTLNLTINSLPGAPILSTDTTYCKGDVLVNLTATGTGGTLNWYDLANLSNLIATGGTFMPFNNMGSTTYYVQELDGNGCLSPVSSVIVVIENCGEIVIPTAFTPDGDNVNDTWQVANLDELYPESRVVIFNRWGNQVFEFSASAGQPYGNNAWDGRNQSNNELLPVGSYYYIIETGDQEVGDFKGTVSIIMK